MAKFKMPTNPPDHVTLLTPDSKLLFTTSLVTDGCFSIGRSSQNDIVLKDTKISKRHAILAVCDGICWIEDLNSRWGTSVNGAKIHSRKLYNNDRIVFGSLAEIRIQSHELPASVPCPPSRSRWLIRVDDKGDYLWKIDLQEGVTTIGRSRTNSVFLHHPFVSRQHCRIEVASSGTIIRALCPVNSLLLNNNRTIEAVLQDHDAIEIAVVRCIYREVS